MATKRDTLIAEIASLTARLAAETASKADALAHAEAHLKAAQAAQEQADNSEFAANAAYRAAFERVNAGITARSVLGFVGKDMTPAALALIDLPSSARYRNTLYKICERLRCERADADPECTATSKAHAEAYTLLTASNNARNEAQHRVDDLRRVSDRMAEKISRLKIKLAGMDEAIARRKARTTPTPETAPAHEGVPAACLAQQSLVRSMFHKLESGKATVRMVGGTFLFVPKQS
jgi:peptidoglycan hydrolase CwlO-like protein